MSVTCTSSPGSKSFVGSKLSVDVPSPLYAPRRRLDDWERWTTKSVCPAALMFCPKVTSMLAVLVALFSFRTGESAVGR